MKIEAYVTLTLKDTTTGKLLKKSRFKSESYVLAMLDLLRVQVIGASYTIKVTSGGNVALAADSHNLRSSSSATVSTNGIVVGIGDTAVVIADYAMETQIAHGVGAGQLFYQANQFINPSTVGSRRHFYQSREFDNQSGGTITAKECGIYTETSTASFVCIIRDIIPNGGEAVGHNQTLTIQYEYYIEV